MNAPPDLCPRQAEAAKQHVCSIHKDDTGDTDLERIAESISPSRRDRPLSDLLANLTDPHSAMQKYRLSAQLLADGGLGLDDAFITSWLDYDDKENVGPLPNETGAEKRVKVSPKKEAHNPLLFALSRPKMDLKLPLEEVDAGSFSSDETETCLASSSLHGDSLLKNAFDLRQKDPSWSKNPFDDELNMIETMIADHRQDKLPPSAAIAGWTQGEVKRESVRQYAKIQVPHRMSKAPKLQLKEEPSELDYFLSDFDYSQFQQPPTRPPLPLKESKLPEIKSISGPIIIKSSQEDIAPRAKLETFRAASRTKQVTEGQKLPLKPLISLDSDEIANAPPSRSKATLIEHVTVQDSLPAHPLASASPQMPNTVNDLPPFKAGTEEKMERINDTKQRGQPILPPCLPSTRMPGSWSSSESSSSPTSSEPFENVSKGGGLSRFKDVWSATVSNPSSKKPSPSLQKKGSLGNLFAIASKHGLRKEKDYLFKSKPKTSRESIVMPSISLEEHFTLRNTPVIVMKKRPVPARRPSPPLQAMGQSMSLQEHFEARNTPVTVMQPQIESTKQEVYPRKVVRKPSQRH